MLKNKDMEISQRIMVVEDSDFNQLIAESFLKAWGYKPVAFQNAIDALTALKKEKFELILLDLMMPKMDGFEFLSQLQKRKDKTPVIVISALTELEHINRAMGLGAVDYITKPYDSSKLKDKIAKLLNQQE
jgi:two-component system response regulator FlrC